MNRLLLVGAFVGFLTLAVPAAGMAADAQTTSQYSTSMTELYGSAAPYTGRLELTISPGGIVGGHYFSADGTEVFIPVVGGKDGDSIWFDIGSSGNLHFSGRFKNKVIVGTAFDKGNAQYTFVANPSTLTGI